VTLPVVVLDCLGHTIEVPLLLSDVLSPFLQPNVVGSMAFSNSTEWKSRSDVEWSIDMETKLIAHSLVLNLVSLINIDNIPHLVLSFAVAENSNSCAFDILRSLDIKYFTVLHIDELVALVLEDLEPSRVGAPDLHVIGFS
jgi:hypothetical protein